MGHAICYAAAFAAGVIGFTLVSTDSYAADFKVLYSFQNTPDGSYPAAGLTRFGKILYGATGAGGANRYGTVYSITLKGAETVLYSFQNTPDGNLPISALTNVHGTFMEPPRTAVQMDTAQYTQ